MIKMEWISYIEEWCQEESNVKTLSDRRIKIEAIITLKSWGYQLKIAGKRRLLLFSIWKRTKCYIRFFKEK